MDMCLLVVSSHPHDILHRGYLEGQLMTVRASLSESAVRDQSLFDRAASLQGDVVTMSNAGGKLLIICQSLRLFSGAVGCRVI